jgi:hypothetical protein
LYAGTSTDPPISSGLEKGLNALCMENENQCRRFIEDLTEAIFELKPRIVGCSNPFQQTNFSLALARALKRHLPNLVFVAGGPNCDGTMGEEIVASFGGID